MWTISGSDAGSLIDANGTIAFSNIGTLTGGTATDDYTVSGTGSLSGA